MLCNLTLAALLYCSVTACVHNLSCNISTNLVVANSAQAYPSAIAMAVIKHGFVICMNLYGLYCQHCLFQGKSVPIGTCLR